VSTVNVVINATGGQQAQGEAKKAAQGFEELAAKAKGAGVSAGQTTQAFRQLPAQITDTFTSLAGGQSPLLVLLQQGGQVTDSFGGIKNAARALATVFTPLRLLIGGTAGALAAVALATNQAQNEQALLSNAVASSGNAAGTSADQLNRYAREVAGVKGTIGGAIEALAALTASGRVGSSELTSAASVAVRAQKLLGTSIADTVQAYAALGRDPVAASLKLNEGTNYLTAALLRQITALKAQGNDLAAAALAQDAYSAAQERTLKAAQDNLGTMEKALKAITGTAADWWDQLVGIGRPEDLAAQLKRTEEALEAAKKPLAQKFFELFTFKFPDRDVKLFGDGFGDLRSPAQKAAQVQAVQDQKNALQESQRLDKLAAAAREKRVAEEKKALDDLSPARQQARAALSLQQGLAGPESQKRQKQAELQDLQALREADLLGLSEYVIKKAQLQAQELEADLRLIEARRRAELAVKPQNQNETLAQSARLVALRNQQAAIEQALLRNRGDAAKGLPGQASRELSTEFEGADRAQLKGVLDENVKRLRERQDAAAQSLDDLVQQNRKAGIDLIKDDRTRGLAQIALFKEQETAKLAALAGQPEKYAAGQEAINEAVRLKTVELTDKVKPEWQRMLDEWTDTTKLMAQAMDNSLTGALKSAEDAFVQFAQTGKLSVRGLVNTVIAEFARAQFRHGMSALLRMFAGGGSDGELRSGDGLPVQGFDRPGEGFAKGGAFTNQVVDTATPFKFARGGMLRKGLMGEAGPEAIMPLTRDSSGRLGVRAQGDSSGTTYNIVVQGDATASTRRMIEETLARHDQQRRRMGMA
jgi:lambda family phage tail tape measure protein